MRKIITSSVLILLFSLFSGSVFAGKIEACENIKHDPAYKGLYGLCNAYWNANENAQDKILAKFEKKAGPDGPGMPGLVDPEPEPVVCPCWAEGQIDIGVEPDIYGCQVLDSFAFASYDGAYVQYIVDGGMNYCGYYNLDLGDFIEYPSDIFGTPALTAEEMDVCETELLTRISEDFVDGCL